MEAQDRLARAYARLTGLQAQLQAHNAVREAYAREYHGALDHLDACGFDIDEFRIGREHFSSDQIPGQQYVEATLFLAKLAAVLTYFKLVTSEPDEPKRQLGFHGPRR